MRTGFLSLRSQLALVEKRSVKRLFFNGPIATDDGLCFTNAFQASMLMTDRSGSRIVWRSSTGAGPYEFDVVAFLGGGLVAGHGIVKGVAAFSTSNGALMWIRDDCAGLWWRGGRLFSSTAGETSILEIDAATGSDVRQLLANDRQYGIFHGASAEVILRHNRVTGGIKDNHDAPSFRCISVEDGAVVWERDVIVDCDNARNAESQRDLRYLVPGSLGDRWVGRWRDMTVAIASEDGRLLWLAPYRLGLVADVHGGRVFGMDEGGLFHVLDERTGELIARHDGTGLEDVMFPRPAAMLDDYAVYGTESGHVIVFDPGDARVVWSKRHQAGTPNVGVVDGRVYVATEKGELLVYERA